jgi:hypothetical protein
MSREDAGIGKERYAWIFMESHKNISARIDNFAVANILQLRD